jgi:hypothetical protein
VRLWKSACTAAEAFEAFWLRHVWMPSSTTTATARPISAGRPYSAIHFENCLTSSPSCDGTTGAGSVVCGSFAFCGILSSMGVPSYWCRIGGGFSPLPPENASQSLPPARKNH